MAEKIEPKGRQASFIEEAGQGPVGHAVLAGEKPMTQHSETRCWSVRCAQGRGNAMTLSIMKCQGFFFQEVVFQSNITLGE
jgi:hypothetical protein